MAYSLFPALSITKRAIAKRPLIEIVLLYPPQAFNHIIGKFKINIALGRGNSIHLNKLFNLRFILF